MGVPQFFSFLKKYYPQAMQTELPGRASSLAVDMNSLFHRAAGIVYGYADDNSLSAYEKKQLQKEIEAADPEQLKLELKNEIWNQLVTIINQVQPQDAIIIAVDGMAPMAKIQQQRQRRYKSALEKKSKVFDSNAFSPGTELMIDIDNFLKRKLIPLKTVHPRKTEIMFLPHKIIYSGHLAPGEGEHKIMDYYREGIPEGPISAAGGSHVIHGLDGDLIMLSMLLPQRRVFLMREDITDIVNIQRLREAIEQDLGTPTAINDFLVLMYLIGNDFLPRIKTMDNIAEVNREMIEVYREVGRSLTTADGEHVHWTGLAYFLHALKRLEPTFAQKMSHIEYQYPSKVLEKSIRRGKLDFSIFRSNWYDYALAPPIGSKSLIHTFKLPEELTQVTTEQIQEMSLEFLTGMAWTSLYYRKGMAGVNREWFYPYFYAPLLQDLAVIAAQVAIRKMHIHEVKVFPKMFKYNVVHQLLCILPPPSVKLFPEEVKAFLLPQSPIIDQFPETFLLDEDGKHAEWQFHALVPHANIHRIYTVTEFVQFEPKTVRALAPQDDYLGIRKTVQQIRTRERPPFGRWVPQRGRGPSRGRGRGERGRRRRPPPIGAIRVVGGRLEMQSVEESLRAEEEVRRVRVKPARRPVPPEPMRLPPVKRIERVVEQIRFQPKGRILKVKPSRIQRKEERTPLEILAQFDVDYSTVPILFE